MKSRVWNEYGAGRGERFLLMRSHQAARWFDAETHEWASPELSNIAPAIAWALYSPEAPGELRRQEWSSGWKDQSQILEAQGVE